MNDLLKQRIGRLLDSLSDERGYQILDFIEFLDSKYAERARPSGILAKITETVEDTMRAGKLPIQAISGTMGIMDGAAKVMKGLAAAGQAVVDEAVKAAEQASKPSDQVAAPEPPAVPPTTQQSGPAPNGDHGEGPARQLAPTEFIRGIGPLAAISLVVGSMIGSGIFIVSADIGRQVGRGARARCCWSGSSPAP